MKVSFGFFFTLAMMFLLLLACGMWATAYDQQLAKTLAELSLLPGLPVSLYCLLYMIRTTTQGADAPLFSNDH